MRVSVGMLVPGRPSFLSIASSLVKLLLVFFGPSLFPNLFPLPEPTPRGGLRLRKFLDPSPDPLPPGALLEPEPLGAERTCSWRASANSAMARVDMMAWSRGVKT